MSLYVQYGSAKVLEPIMTHLANAYKYLQTSVSL